MSNKSPKPSPKDKVRQDIKTYEHNKRVKGLMTAGGLGALGLAGYGSATKKNLPKYTGLGAALVAGALRGRAAREEEAALNRVKRYYDLRDKAPSSLLSREAYTPSEKVATFGAVADTITAAISGLKDKLLPSGGTGSFSHGLSGATSSALAPALGSAAPVVGSLVPLGIDYVTLPRIAKGYTEALRDYTHVSLKSEMGLPLTLEEKKKLLAAQKSGIISQQIASMPDGKSIDLSFVNRIKNPFLRGALPKTLPKNWAALRKELATHNHDIFGGAASKGYSIGTAAAKPMKMLYEFSPTLAEQALASVKSDYQMKKLMVMLRQRGGKYREAADILQDTLKEIPGAEKFLASQGEGGKKFISELLEHPEKAPEIAKKIREQVVRYVGVGKETGKILESTVDEIPGLRALLRLTGKNTQGIAQQIVDRPELAKELAESLKGRVQAGVRGVKGALLAGALLGVGQAVGKYRNRHPLSKNELPEALAKKANA